ncbi:hypothetical protein ACFQ4A_06160 [Lentibacillus salinarum]|uniref:Transposase n=1 Tax=Lentibacillus salinarum TaxID=446820 RepID=A0ABW3ZSB0_9BACI
MVKVKAEKEPMVYINLYILSYNLWYNQLNTLQNKTIDAATPTVQ